MKNVRSEGDVAGKDEETLLFYITDWIRYMS